MIAVRVLAPAEFGVYALLVAAVNLLIVAIDFGCKTASTRMVAASDRPTQTGIVHSVLLFRFGVALVAALVLWFGRGLLDIFMGDTAGELLGVAGYAPLMLIVASFDELLLAIHQGFRAYRRMAIAQVSRSVLRVSLSAVALLALNMGMLGLIYAWIISFAWSSLYMYLTLPVGRRPEFQPALLKEVLRFGAPLQGNRFLWVILRRADTLLLGAFAGPVAISMYTVAARIPEALQHLADSFIAVFFPTMANTSARGANQQATLILERSLRLVSLAGATAALGAVLFGREIAVLLFSETYAAAGFALGLLMIGFHMSFVTNLLGYTLTATGFPGRSLGVSAARTVAHVAIDVLLIPVLGFVGPAFASVIASYFSNPLAVVALHRSGMAVAVAGYVKQTALLWACAALFWVVQPGALAAKVAILFAFAVANLVFSTLSWDDLSLLSFRREPAQASAGPIAAARTVSTKEQGL
jgi:O-antigen/teichoic acid export membrane protein